MVYPLDLTDGAGNGVLSDVFVGRCFRENSVADILEVVVRGEKRVV